MTVSSASRQSGAFAETVSAQPLKLGRGNAVPRDAAPGPITAVPDPSHKPAGPGDAQVGENALLLNLLKIESSARRAASETELAYLIANETLRLVRGRQMFLLSLHHVSGKFQVASVSSLAVVDRNAPLIQWIEQMVVALKGSEGVGKSCEFVLPAYCDPTDASTRTYPFTNFMWVPLWVRQGEPVLGLLLARDVPWIEADRRLAERLGETYGHAASQLRGDGASTPWRTRLASRRNLFGVIVGSCLLGMFPMSISALAPVEVVARNPEIVGMPVDAIVQEVLVRPNDPVKAGQRLVRLVDTSVRNQLKLAEREVTVARARVQQANSLAFSEAKGRHDLGIVQAELELKLAELEYARDLAEQYSIVSHNDGVAVFSDRKDLEGKPFRTGDRLMQIAAVGALELEIDLPVADSIVLQKGAALRIFLDSDPLNAIRGTVSHIDYRARLSKTNVAVYRIVGTFDEVPTSSPRLGTRGSVQVEGPSGTLALYLFRRPLSAIRQRFAL
jgi:Barrel-sandwich domain of CusB or HlyD membrane-fusion